MSPLQFWLQVGGSIVTALSVVKEENFTINATGVLLVVYDDQTVVWIGNRQNYISSTFQGGAKCGNEVRETYESRYRWLTQDMGGVSADAKEVCVG
jgi:hypothetical protein